MDPERDGIHGPAAYGYMADVSTTTGLSSNDDATVSAGGSPNDEAYYDYEDWMEDPEWAEDADSYYEANEELQIEEDVICWFVEQGVHPQTCSPEDLDMMYDAVEAETTAYFVRDNAQKRGFTAPASSNMYQSQSSLSPEERQAKVMAAKQRSRCRACGQQGHWKHDPVCPKRRFTSKGKGLDSTKEKAKERAKDFDVQKEESLDTTVLEALHRRSRGLSTSVFEMRQRSHQPRRSFAEWLSTSMVPIQGQKKQKKKVQSRGWTRRYRG